MPPKSVAARIEARIHVIRGERVMLDADLAALYGVTTGALNLATRRNPGRFPPDFMFQLNRQEAGLIFQTQISKVGSGGCRFHPYSFTQDGVVMLTSVLMWERASGVNVVALRT